MVTKNKSVVAWGRGRDGCKRQCHEETFEGDKVWGFFHGFMHMSKLIKLYILYIVYYCIF